jgi:hypothetical protein
VPEKDAKLSEGKKYDTEKPPMDLLSPIAMEEISKVLGFGKGKYGTHNWRAGIAWSRVIAATLRHISSFNGGEDKDPETGLSHLAHAACGLMFLLEYEARRPEFDDRYKVKCSHQYKAPLHGNDYRCTHCGEEIVWKIHNCL